MVEDVCENEREGKWWRKMTAEAGKNFQVLDMRRATGGPLAVLSLQFQAEICHLRLKASL